VARRKRLPRRNVTALISTSGQVVERFAYDSYGQPTILAPDWTTRGSSQYAWVHNHQGGRHEVVTGLYHFRHRDLNPTLGRWLQLDPSDFAAGDTNLYRYVHNSPVNYVDPSGLQQVQPITPITWPVVEPYRPPPWPPGWPRLQPPPPGWIPRVPRDFPPEDFMDDPPGRRTPPPSRGLVPPPVVPIVGRRLVVRFILGATCVGAVVVIGWTVIEVVDIIGGDGGGGIDPFPEPQPIPLPLPEPRPQPRPGPRPPFEDSQPPPNVKCCHYRCTDGMPYYQEVPGRQRCPLAFLFEWPRFTCNLNWETPGPCPLNLPIPSPN
jgi:RHS repeat-associated protein